MSKKGMSPQVKWLLFLAIAKVLLAIMNRPEEIAALFGSR